MPSRALLAGGAVAYGIAVVRARRRYRPFSRDDSPELADSFASLAAELEVEPAPSLRWQPIDQRAVGLAFGPPGNRELAFTGGLVPLSVRDRPAFRAIVLHELAHLRNGDVDLSYYAIGLWRALLVLAMLPFVLTLLRELPSDPATVASFGWRFLLLVPLVYIIRSAILRAREHDADVRASTREPEIRRVLATAAAKEPSHSKLRRLVAWHPSTAHRVDVIDDPSPLLRLGLLDAFGIGIVGSLAYEDVALVLGMAGMDAIAARGLAAFAFGPLVGVILALGTWRQTFAYLATGRSSVRVVPLGLALVAGLLVGQRLGFTAPFGDDAVLLRPDVAPFHIWLGILVGIGAILFVAWLVATARLWLPVATRLRSPGRASLPIALGAAALLGIAIAVFQIVVGAREVVEFTLGLPNDLYASGARPDPAGRSRVAVASRAGHRGPGLHRRAARPRVLPPARAHPLGGGPVLRPDPARPDRDLGRARRHRRPADHRAARAPVAMGDRRRASPRPSGSRRRPWRCTPGCTPRSIP